MDTCKTYPSHPASLPGILIAIFQFGVKTVKTRHFTVALLIGNKNYSLRSFQEGGESVMKLIIHIILLYDERLDNRKGPVGMNHAKLSIIILLK